MSLNLKQQKFVEVYLINGSATEAYIQAYPGVKRTSAAAQGEKLMRNNEVIKKIEDGKAELAKKNLITKEKLIQDLINIKTWHQGGNYKEAQTALKAIDLLVKMLGFNAPAQQEVTLKGEQPLFGPDEASE